MKRVYMYINFTLHPWHSCFCTMRDNPHSKPTVMMWVCLQADIIHIHHRHLLLLLSLKADTHFKGGRLCKPSHCSKGVQPMAKYMHVQDCHDRYKCPRWNSTLGPLVLQSGIGLHAHMYRHIYIYSYIYYAYNCRAQKPKCKVRQRSNEHSFSCGSTSLNLK